MSGPLGLIAELLLTTVGVLLIARTPRNRALFVITTLSYVGRVVLGLALFIISLERVPVLTAQQYPGGFWAIAADAVLYDHDARGILAFLHGGALPQGVRSFSWIVAGLYAAFGMDPAVGAVFSAAMAALCVPLTFQLARTIGSGDRGACFAAALVAFWPSSFAWSSFVLKDSLQWLALLMILTAAAGLLAAAEAIAASSRKLLRLSGAALVGSALSSWQRGLLVTPILLVGVFGSTVFSVVRYSTWRRRRALIPYAALGLAVGLGSLSMQADLYIYQPTIAASAGEIGSMLAMLKSWKPLQPSGAPAPTPLSSPFLGSPPAAKRPPNPRPGASLPPGHQAASEAAQPAGPPCAPATTLLAVRGAFIQAGGASLVDRNVPFDSCRDVLAYAPRAFELTFLSPLPAQWAATTGSLGSLRAITALDAIPLWLLSPGLIVGAVVAVLKPARGRSFLLLFLLLLGFLLPVAVPNYGSFFRLRLMAIFPAVVLSTYGWESLLGVALRVWHRKPASNDASCG
ncbi:MAG: hypothetical protein ACYDAG_11515 [Chloroflexota bacterium]